MKVSMATKLFFGWVFISLLQHVQDVSSVNYGEMSGSGDGSGSGDDENMFVHAVHAGQLGVGSCPSEQGWDIFDGFCYYISPNSAKKWPAEQKCLAMNAQLTSVHSNKENSFLIRMMKKYPTARTLWIGLNDINREGAYEWTDETNVDYTDWMVFSLGESEPRYSDNGNRDEDCVRILRRPSLRATGTWGDKPCSTSCRYSCKKEIRTGCQNDIMTEAELGARSKFVTWENLFLTDSASKTGLYENTEISKSHVPGQEFPIGATVVQYNFTDSSDNSLLASCTFTVFVKDTTPPSVTGCPSDIVVTKELGISEASVTWIKPNASDFSDLEESKTHAPGENFGIGSTRVVYNFTDSYGNAAVCAFTVTLTIEDTTPPVISKCPSYSLHTTSGIGFRATGAKVNWIEPTATDLSGTPMRIRSHKPGSKFHVGVTSVTYIFMDSSSNIANCTFLVIVDPVDVLSSSVVSSSRQMNSSSGLNLIITAAVSCTIAVVLMIALVAMVIYVRRSKVQPKNITMRYLVENDSTVEEFGK